MRLPADERVKEVADVGSLVVKVSEPSEASKA